MWTQAFAVFGVVLVPIGVPAAFTFYMLRAKQNLGGVVNQTKLGGAKLSSPDIDDDGDTYGFLTKDYRPECWYYEIVTVRSPSFPACLSCVVDCTDPAALAVRSQAHARRKLRGSRARNSGSDIFRHRHRSFLPHAAHADVSFCGIQTQRDRSTGPLLAHDALRRDAHPAEPKQECMGRRAVP